MMTSPRQAKRTAIANDTLPVELAALLHDPTARQRVNQLVAALPPPHRAFVRRSFGVGMSGPGSWVLAATFLGLSRSEALSVLETVLRRHAADALSSKAAA